MGAMMPRALVPIDARWSLLLCPSFLFPVSSPFVPVTYGSSQPWSVLRGANGSPTGTQTVHSVLQHPTLYLSCYPFIPKGLGARQRLTGLRHDP
ncbi:hypothetical protein B0T09DRAFT_348313 [Sordaria sp. MPI-SDFR-AT-0083]|nr:hypothetical protein B0T09DRAFT_348313 [Sordaria sp. MPI-SDFR-AT-0083]